MSSAKTIVATSVLSAVLVAAIAAPLGYFGYEKLKPMMDGKSGGVPSVVIELKAELVQEIQSSADKTRADVQARLSESEAKQKSSIDELKMVVAELKAEQSALLTRLKNVAQPSQSEAPGSRSDAHNLTILFPLAKVKGPLIDNQIERVVADAEKYLKAGPCTTNVLGFSDTLGNDVANLKLSQKRAEYVAGKVRKAGIKVSEVKGWGERWLVVHTLDGVKKPQNRRVVVEILCKGTAGTDKAPMPSS